MDVSLLKNTHIGERVDVQFRAECFNVLNHTNFGRPQPDRIYVNQGGESDGGTDHHLKRNPGGRGFSSA